MCLQKIRRTQFYNIIFHLKYFYINGKSFNINNLYLSVNGFLSQVPIKHIPYTDC